MSDKTIPTEDVKAILGGLNDPKLANLKAKIEKRRQIPPQNSQPIQEIGATELLLRPRPQWYDAL